MIRIDGGLVRSTRESLGLTQSQLAQKMGMTKAGVSKLELTGYASNPTRILLNQYLGLSLALNANKDTPTRRDALFSAYEVCIVMKDHCGNVLVTDKNEHDQFLYSHADNFIKWYENNLKN